MDNLKPFNQFNNNKINNEDVKIDKFIVFESKFRYLTNKNILFIGTYDKCVEVIFQNPTLDLEISKRQDPVVIGLDIDEKIKSKNVAIIGSRGFNNYTYAKNEINNILDKNDITISKIISGGAIGSDKIAEIYSDNYNIPIDIFKPDWSIGRHAGIVRNTKIVNESDVVIALWDGKTKGTKDSIQKAKKLGKNVYIIDISIKKVNEGVRLNGHDEFIFNFNRDLNGDLMKLKYNKDYITTKKTKNINSYYSFKIHWNVDKNIKKRLLEYIKYDLKKTSDYEKLLNKAMIGLFNNPHFEMYDVDMILMPESGSNLNFDIATKIKNKTPNSYLSKEIISKNDPGDITLDYNILKELGYKHDTIHNIEKIIKKATVKNVFKMKKIPPKFRKYIINFLKMDSFDRKNFNTLTDGKIFIIDDFISQGTTFSEIERIVEKYATKEVIYYTLIS